MILTCPECATRYQTDAAAFVPDGRKVRCAKCGHVWHQAAPEPEADFAEIPEMPEPPVLAEPETPQRSAYAPSRAAETAAPPQPARWLDRLGLAVGWVALAAIVLVIGWSGLRYRQDIASLWPQSATLYEALGLKVNTVGIAFVDVTFDHQTEDGQQVLAVSGKLVNISSHELSVPPIRVSLTDDDKRELYHWNFSPAVATLGPGQVAPFATRMSSPPPGARHLEVRFAENGN